MSEHQSESHGATPTPAVAQPVQPVYAPPVENPGQLLGIFGLILGIIGLSGIGIILSIISTVKSGKANASKTLGIVGIVVNIISMIITLVLIVLFIIGAVIAAGEKSKDVSKHTQEETVAASSVALSDRYTVPGGNGYWGFPASVEGWTIDVLDKDGVNRLMKANKSASFETYQGAVADDGKKDSVQTEDVISDYATTQNATLLVSTGQIIAYPTMSGKPDVQFKRYDYTKVGANGQKIKGRIAVRSFGGHQLAVVYEAYADSFSETDWKLLSGKLKVNDGMF
ncbi:MAG: hypothetical protein WAQ25_02195 [Candidatus Saccharimonas sp.]